MSDYSPQEPLDSNPKDYVRTVMWSLASFFTSFGVLFLLVWLSSDEHLIPICALLIIAGFTGLGMALLVPVYAKLKNKVVPVVLTLIYLAFALPLGSFLLAISGWALYTNGLH